MCPRGDAMLFFCILFVAGYCTVTMAQMPVDCCLRVKNKPLDKIIFADHRRQIRGQGCSLDAMILVTRRGVKLCVPIDKPWVKDVMKHVDSLKKHCKKHNYQSPRCTGVNRE